MLYVTHAEHILHIKQSARFIRQKVHRAQRAQCVAGAAARAMGQLDALALSGKQNGVSPTISPPRIAEKPISNGLRAPVIGVRPQTDILDKSHPVARAMISPILSAVPEGASALCRLCASIISISYRSLKSRAAVSINLR